MLIEAGCIAYNNDPWPEGSTWPVKNLNHIPIFVISLLNSTWFWDASQMVWVVFRYSLKEATCNMEPRVSLSRFFFLQPLFLVYEQAIKKTTLPAYFRIRENEFLISVIRDPHFFFPFVNRTTDPHVRSSTNYENAKQASMCNVHN